MGIRLKKKLTHILERNFPLFEYTTMCVNLCFYPNIQTSKTQILIREVPINTFLNISTHVYLT